VSDKVPDGCPLTPRQFEILQLLGDGLTVKQAAQHLGVTASTIRSLNHKAYASLGAADATQAIVIMGRRGWIGWRAPEPPPEPAGLPPTPLAVEHPFLAAYLREFERSRWPHEPDRESAAGMRLALAGHRITTRPTSREA
jgi:DNA-binding CsgD family transcriptional regulator